MRVYPISSADYSIRMINKNSNNLNLNHMSECTRPSFKGAGGALGSILGTVVGVGLGAISGGIGTVLFASMLGCAAGGLAGDAGEKTNDCDYFEHETIETEYEGAWTYL